MGNVDSRASYAGGYMYLHLDKPIYNPGEMVNGTIYLRNSAPIDVSIIDIEVIGKEKARWYEERTRTEERDGASHIIRWDEKMDESKKVFKYAAPVF